MMKILLPIVLIIGLVLGVLFWRFYPELSANKAKQDGMITLNLWSLNNDAEEFKVVIDRYQQAHPNIKINYTQADLANYRTRVSTKIQGNEGPDIFMIHNSWLPMFVPSNLIAAMPKSVMSSDEYAKTFYPVAMDSLSAGGKIYAMPSELDGLVMFINDDIFRAGGLSAPKSWPEFISDANRLTVRDAKGQILSAGAAIGVTQNVDYWSDILGLLFYQQPEADLVHPNAAAKSDPNTFPGADILKFYTRFVTDLKVWDPSLENSTTAFEKGRLAIYFGSASKIQEIRKANPNLHFSIAPVPQLSYKSVGWGSFWAWTVSSRAVSIPEAWNFLKYLTSADVERYFYQQMSQGGGVGRPYARVDMQAEMIGDPVLGVFVSQGPAYKSWYLTSGTQDQGLDEAVISDYQGAVEAVLQGQDPQSALQTTSKKVQADLAKYFPSASPVGK